MTSAVARGTISFAAQITPMSELSMRVLFASLLLVPLSLAQERPIELTPAEIEALASEKIEDREPVLKKIDGKIIKLTGLISGHQGGGFTINVSPGAKKKILYIGFTFVKDARIAEYIRTTEYNTSINQPGRGTIYVRANTSTSVTRPTADYKVPDNLKPRPRPVPMFESLDQTQARIQAAIIEAGEAERKIMEDARKKGKTETVTVYRMPAPFKDAAPDMKYLPKESAKKE